MLAFKKQTTGDDMSGYFSPRVYDGKRVLSADDAARRKKQAAQSIAEAKKRARTKKRELEQA